MDHFFCHLLLEAFLNFWLALSDAGFAISGIHNAETHKDGNVIEEQQA
jgi:hypothetical protein